MAGILLGVVGAVTGYYFGKQGLDRAQSLAQEAENEKKKAQELAEELAVEKKKAEKRGKYIDEFKEQSEIFYTAANKYTTLIKAARTDPDLKDKIDKILSTNKP